jgi:hypothetical protein
MLCVERADLFESRNNRGDSFLARRVWKHMAWQGVDKSWARKQLFGLLRKITVYVVRSTSNFPRQFTSSINNGDEVFDIFALHIPVTAAYKRLKL